MKQDIYDWKKYYHEQQMIVDGAGVVIVWAICYTLTVADRSKHINWLVDNILQHGGNLNEWYAQALIVHMLILKVRGDLKIKTSAGLEAQKKHIRIMSACLSAFAISMIEMFLHFGNYPDIKDVPAWILWAFLLYFTNKKSIKPIYRDVPPPPENLKIKGKK